MISALTHIILSDLVTRWITLGDVHCNVTLLYSTGIMGIYCVATESMPRRLTNCFLL